MIPVDYVAVLLAAVIGFVVGFVWYHPSVFGTVWMRLARVTPDMSPAGKQKMIQSTALGFVATLVASYVLAHFIAVWGATSVVEAAQFGFWTWLGFQMPILIGSALWEQKHWNLFFLNGAYWLVSTIIIAEVLVWLS